MLFLLMELVELAGVVIGTVLLLELYTLTNPSYPTKLHCYFIGHPTEVVYNVPEQFVLFNA